MIGLSRQKDLALTIIMIVLLLTVLLEPLEASGEMRVLGVADASLYFVDEKNIKVAINYTSYSYSAAALAAIFDNETLREYFRNKIINYTKEKCAEASEPTGINAIRFNTEIEPRVDFIKGQNWSRISISFNLTGEGEPILGKGGEYWVHYEFRGGFLQLIRGGVLHWITIVRPPLPIVLVDVLKLTVTLPKGYSAIQVVPRQSSAVIDWRDDRVTLVWIFRDPLIEKRDSAVTGIQDLFLDLKSLGNYEKNILKRLGDLEDRLEGNMPYTFNSNEVLRLLGEVSLARFEERAFQTLSDSYLEGLVSETEQFLRKVLLLKVAILVLPLISFLLSASILYKKTVLTYLRKLFGKISRLTNESEKIMNLNLISIPNYGKHSSH